ncbi:MAG TPA: GNAT family N-acetyltransferase [Acidimicrobiales bacterium]|nr:GNAT family N-acetyltransferase [Acidimicrobiales bacterium]
MTRAAIDEFDPHTSDEAAFRSRWELVVALEAEDEPEQPTQPFDKHRQSLVDRPSFQRPRHWTAWDGDGAALGHATLELEYVESNRHLAWFWIGVRNDARRQGIGTQLLSRIVEAATLDGRSVLGAGTIEGSGGDRFCETFGFERKATERKSRLAIDDVDRGMLERWVSRASDRAQDYELFGFDDRCPDDLLEPFVELWKVTNTAPRDDLDMEDDLPTPERFREAQDKALAQGDTSWRVIARHRPSGALAGFTELFFAPFSDTVAFQGWTAVHPDHRRLGIGRWLKAAACLRLMDERPAVRHVDTWNAFSNAPMLAINIEMGFQLLRGYNEWQAPTDRLTSAVKERIGG